MTYKIAKTLDGYRPLYRRWFLYRPLLDYMNRPAIFGTEEGAHTFIIRSHCNWLNSTEWKRIKWFRGLDPRVKG